MGVAGENRIVIHNLPSACREGFKCADNRVCKYAGCGWEAEEGQGTGGLSGGWRVTKLESGGESALSWMFMAAS